MLSADPCPKRRSIPSYQAPVSQDNPVFALVRVPQDNPYEVRDGLVCKLQSRTLPFAADRIVCIDSGVEDPRDEDSSPRIRWLLHSLSLPSQFAEGVLDHRCQGFSADGATKQSRKRRRR
ncbi:unnamed protein product [Thelazia callipaeda]|uniref:Glycosyltransferase n=1 Tax=Thelazia callipaeda TaxID=103827 RepID=A0A0N5CTS1_THECL|nr:unnamed protein product [Thelazia callipaeda]